MSKRTILIDFDGVLHEYKTPFSTAEIIADGPVEGALDWLRNLLASTVFDVCIYSSRSKTLTGISAMQSWLLTHGLEEEFVSAIRFPTEKPGAFLTIDDRCLRFNGPGSFPSIDNILEFRPWNRKE